MSKATLALVVSILVLTVLIVTIGMARVLVPKPDDRIATIKLCSSYYAYRDETRKTIEAMENLCWP